MTVVRPETDVTGGRPVVPARGALRPLGLGEVRITGGFWGQRQRVNGEATIDHARTWLDRLGWTGNFLAARRGRGSPERRGREFSDSEVYKLIEAIAWEHGRAGEPARDAELRELTALIGNAQAPDGYLSTAFGGPGQRARYSDLGMGHELYCAGHLLQAAVARARTAGPDELLDVAVRVADHVCDTFSHRGNHGLCGHPQIEPALVELARVTGEQRYLEQAAIFVERRGHRSLPRHEFGWQYYSDDIPVWQADVLRGHAVRALYLACGAVDVAVETNDDELLEAVVAQFDRTLARRTYVTGGMGSHHADEAFGNDFELPPDRAYSETCAAIAAIMLAWRLLLATGDVRYADVIERLLVNVVATSIADDGRAFFYANTLHQRVMPERVSADEERLSFGGGARAPWYEVSCCLPNLARILASLSAYLAAAGDDGLYIFQFADADIRTRLSDGRTVAVSMRTEYPDAGTVTLTVTETAGGPWALNVRVPEWAESAVLVDDQAGRRALRPGLGRIVREFAVGDQLRLRLPMRSRWVFPDPRIDAVRGCVVAQRGPAVLCAESVDQSAGSLDELWVDPSVALDDTADGTTARGVWRRLHESSPYQFTEAAGEAQPTSVRLVPYHRWARRGPSTMRVWLPRTDHT